MTLAIDIPATGGKSERNGVLRFVIPGMGLLLLDAISQRDYPIITGVSLVIGFSVMLINLAVDLSYGLLDPKVRYR